MYLRLKIENLSDGKYPLLGDDLSFNAEDVDIDRMLDDPNSIADNTIDFIISKKDAIEIARTLFDSENFLTKEIEETICDMEERLGY